MISGVDMEKYKFKLEKLLNIRKENEEKAKKEFMEAQREMKKVQEIIQELKDKHNKYNFPKANESIIERKIRDNYLNALEQDIINSENLLKEKIAFVEIKRKEVMAKQIDRKTVEKLKDKGQEIFDKEQSDIEQKANDEFALFGYMRNHEGR